MFFSISRPSDGSDHEVRAAFHNFVVASTGNAVEPEVNYFNFAGYTVCDFFGLDRRPCQAVRIGDDRLLIVKGPHPRTPEEVDRFFAQHLHFSNGQVRLSEAFGGSCVFALLNANTGSATIWCSEPPMFSIYYAAEGCVHASTRPRLTAHLVNPAKRPSLSERYISTYLASGYPLDDASPFDNVKTLLFGEVLHLADKAIVSTAHPNPLLKYRWGDDREDVSKEATESLIRAFQSAGSPRSLEVFMSGGVDSRILLAAGLKVNPELSATTLQSPETFAAERVTGIMGKKADVLTVEFQRGFAQESVSRAIWNAGGLINAEAHVLPLDGVFARQDPHSVSFGNWPLYKGGYMKGFPKGIGKIANKVRTTALPSQVASADIIAECNSLLSRWIMLREPAVPLELLYLFALEFRSWRWLMPNVLSVSAHHDAVYPFMDELFVRSSSAANPEDRATHRLAFRIMRRLDERLVNVGLHGVRWKFESEGPASDFLAGYEARAPLANPPQKGKSRALSTRRPGLHDKILMREMIADHLLTSHNRHLLSADAAAAVGSGTVEDFSSLIVGNYAEVWRMFALAVFISRSWDRQ